MAYRAHQVSDEELWVISGPDWSLPISCIPVKRDEQELYAVSDVIGFTMPQWTAANNVISPASVGTDSHFWFVPRAGLAAIATKAPGINARWYLMWNHESPVKPKLSFDYEPPLDTPEPSAATAEFLEHIAWKARALSKEDVMFVWDLIVRELPRWLTEKRKPVSFGYFTIWSLPYRVNWKQVLLAKYPNIASIMHMPRERRNAKLGLTTVERDIQHTDLVEFHTNTKSIGWSIEAVTTRHWDEWIQDAEAKRRKNLGPALYARFWSRTIWKLQNTIYDIFGAFVKKTTLPCAEPVRSNSNGVLSLGPCQPIGNHRPVSRDICETASCYYDHSRPVVEYGEPQSLVEEARSLPPTLPSIQFVDEDVRDSGRALPANGECKA